MYALFFKLSTLFDFSIQKVYCLSAEKKMYNEITNLQTRVFIFCKSWAEIEKTPVPQKEIVNQMETQGVSTSSCINAINSLLTKGFIRKAYHLKQSRTYYVLLRNI